MTRCWMWIASVLAVFALASACCAGEIGFVEDFALAKDRDKTLKQLLPGTEEYYYYHCLHYQNLGQLDKVDEVLTTWIRRKGRTGRVQEIENRQALLKYPKEPKASLEYIRRRLGVQFNHQRIVAGRKTKLPTKLDPNRISRQTLTRRALSTQTKTTDGFEEASFDWLVTTKLDADRRRHLLRRLRRPDYPNLVQLIAADLDYKHSRGFGAMPIHRALLRDQLEGLLKRKGELLNQTHFVNVYLTKLRPGEDEDWQNDAKVRQAYLDRLWKFVSTLNPAHNSLKACVLYRRLEHDRRLGVYDKQRFMTYLKLPRHVRYVNPKYLQREEHRRHVANLGANYRSQTLLPPVGRDEPLVRDYLMHFFVQEETYKPYAEYIQDLYLKELFAETKIVHGLGDMEQWYSMLPPAKYQALKERVDLEFAPQNKRFFASDEPVVLDVYVKNVKKLLIKLYEVNALNYYRSAGREVDVDMDLDGLVANAEKVFGYDQPPVRRVRRRFELAELSKRGTYIVELIGNGKSSRAVIRKGRLRYLARTSVAGQVLTVLDERNRKVAGARVWMAGKEYAADKDGCVTIPFSTKPGRTQIVLCHGSVASLDHLDHQAEAYQLVAGIHVDREALLTRKKAAVLVRPALYLNGAPVTLSVLEEPMLVITSTDREGVSTTKEVRDFKLFEDQESTYEFQVPERLRTIRFTLKAKVKNVSRDKKDNLQVTRSFSLNGIEQGAIIEDLHLSHAKGEYFLDVLGKTGETKADRPVNLSLKHRDFRRPVSATLQSDASGRIQLGALEGIVTVSASAEGGASHTWRLPTGACTLPAELHGKAGAALEVPYVGAAKEPTREHFALLEVRGGTYVADRRQALKVGQGVLRLEDLPAGDYELVLKEQGKAGRSIRVRLVAGQESQGYVLGANRHAELRPDKPLEIESVQAGKEKVTIRLRNATKFARVHVVATRYLADYPLYPLLGDLPSAGLEAIRLGKLGCRYVSGRAIGEERRYIIERGYAKKFPGNMLTRPSLLLNPWAIRKTEAGRQVARGGERFGRGRAEGEGRRQGARFAPPGKGLKLRDFANLDYLPAPSVVMANLKPKADGTVTVDRKALGAKQQLHVLAVDPLGAVYREVSLAETKADFGDLTLQTGLDAQKHFTEQKKISIVDKGAKFELADITTSQFEKYDTLSRVYALYLTLSKNQTLTEFAFVVNWPKLKDAEKREKYSKYACHELSFFLYKKDPKFFEQVVLPYLRNKKDKTFLDHYLVGDDLSAYMQPWAHGRLNVVERILLAQRIKNERPHTARHVKDLWDLIPPNVERFNYLFKTALKSRALETTDELGLREAAAGALLAKRRELRGRRAAGKEAGRPSEEAAAAEAPKPAAPATPPARRPTKKPPTDKAAPAARKKAKLEDMARRLGERTEGKGYFKADADRRARVRRLYRKLDKTKEWVENNYYHLPIEKQDASLVTVNGFWKDYAAHDGPKPFLSRNLAEASRSFTEMMLALAVLDLPFDAGEHKADFQKQKMTLQAQSPLVVFHKEIQPAQQAKKKVPILVSQNFFRHGDRYTHVNNEKVDKYVTDEFLVHTVYGCHVVITNPTSSRQKLDALLQVPMGAIPVSNGKYTRGVHIDLQPYRTQTLEYYFYFPRPGDFAQFPVHVAKNEWLIAFAKPASLHVVRRLTKIDKTSWPWVSQNATPQQVLDYLRQHNVQRLDLGKIAWRVQDKGFFEKVLPLLMQRHVYHHTLWSYGLKHNDTAAAREYLKHSPYANQCGSYIDTALLTIDPVERRTYQHMEYWPLVNARAHQLGKRRRIVNERIFQQYNRLLKILTYRRQLDDDDRMAVTYYLLLQDRVAEAIAFFEAVKPDKLATRLQHDCFAAYIDFYKGDTKHARQIATRYADYPVDRWRKRFAQIAAQLDEIEGKAAKVIDDKDRDQVQSKLAATEAGFDFKVEARKVTIDYQNVTSCRVNYYLMDIELLFSAGPFMQQDSDRFSTIRPNDTAIVELPAKKAQLTFDLPKKYHSSNVMVEIAAGGVRKAKAYYANSLAVQVIEQYGQLKVAHADTHKALAKVYVKVYARLKDGRVQFYKDGYTDLRGRFDYTSLNTNELDYVKQFAILVLSDTHGAVVREAAPPKR